MLRTEERRLFDREYLSGPMKDRYLNSAKIFGLTVFTLWHSQYIENEALRPQPLAKLL